MMECPIFYEEGLDHAGWDAVPVEFNLVPIFIHIVPCGDMRMHQLDPTCWCLPEEDDDRADIIIHNSADGREAFERGEKSPN